MERDNVNSQSTATETVKRPPFSVQRGAKEKHVRAGAVSKATFNLKEKGKKMEQKKKHKKEKEREIRNKNVGLSCQLSHEQ